MSEPPTINLAALKICFLAGTLGQGGAERQLFYILKSLRTSGAQPRLLSLTQGDFWEEPIRDLGVPVTWVGQDKSRWQRALCITRALRAQPCDIIQSQHFFTNLYAVAAARVTGKREIGALRSDVHSEIAAHRRLGPASLRAPRWLAANSTQAIANAERLGIASQRLNLLPNVVDTTHFAPVNNHVTIPFTVLMAGRMSAEKRFDLFLQALAQLKESVPCQGILVGDGPLRTQWQTLATQLGLTANEAVFTGTQAELSVYYQQAAAVVLLSSFEGTPNVLLEAMACGVPVIASAVGGVPAILQDTQTGWLLPNENDEAQVTALVSGLRKLAQDDSLRQRLGQAGRDYVLREHSLDQLPRHLQTLYQAVLA